VKSFLAHSVNGVKRRQVTNGKRLKSTAEECLLPVCYFPQKFAQIALAFKKL
jgi:hypothetical protein